MNMDIVVAANNATDNDRLPPIPQVEELRVEMNIKFESITTMLSSIRELMTSNLATKSRRSVARVPIPQQLVAGSKVAVPEDLSTDPSSEDTAVVPPPAPPAVVAVPNTLPDVPLEPVNVRLATPVVSGVNTRERVMLQPVVNLLGDLQQEARPLVPLPPPPPPITLPPAPPTPAPNVTYVARTPGIYFDTEVYPRPTTVQQPQSSVVAAQAVPMIPPRPPPVRNVSPTLVRPLGAPQNAQIPIATYSGQGHLATLAAEYKVEKDDMMMKKSPKAFLRAKLAYVQYKNSYADTSKNLVHFISASVREELIAHEHLIMAPDFSTLNVNSIFRCSDNRLLDMFARLFRPKTPLEYKELVFESLRHINVVDIDKAMRDYDKSLYIEVARFLQEVQEYDDLFRRDATPAQLLNLPLVNYGTQEQPGIFRIFLACFGKISEHFKSMITETTLKSLTSLPAFIEACSQVNRDMAVHAEKSRSIEQKFQPQKKLEPRPERAPRKVPTVLPEGKQLLVVDAIDELAYDLVAEDLPPSDDGDDDDSVAESSISSTSGGNLTNAVTHVFAYQPQPKPQPRHLGNRTIQHAPQPQPSRARKAEPAPPRPCFTMFKKGACPDRKTCPYSHDRAVLAAHAKEIIKRASESPFYDPNA